MAGYFVFLLAFFIFGGGVCYMLVAQANRLAEEAHTKRKYLLVAFLRRLVILAGIASLRAAYALFAPRIKEMRVHARSLITVATTKFEKRFAHVLNLIAGRVTIPKGNSSLYLERIQVHKESLQKGAIDYDFLG